MSSSIFYIHALSPIHMGTGAAVGGIDLPHSRESATDLPNVPGSGIKGVWRDQFPEDDPKSDLPNKSHLFGAQWQGEESSRNQGALLFSDALLLCMPVMSYVADFAWVTSPMSLARFQRERLFTNPTNPKLDLPKPSLGVALTAADCILAHKAEKESFLYLHELKVTAKSCELTTAWATLLASEVFTDTGDWQEFMKRFVVVSEAELVHLSHVAAYVPMRNSLDEDKQVAKGALWSEECMPSESIFWGTVGADSLMKIPAEDSLKWFAAKTHNTQRLQFGGKASIGRGMCRFIVPPNKPSAGQAL